MFFLFGWQMLSQTTGHTLQRRATDHLHMRVLSVQSGRINLITHTGKGLTRDRFSPLRLGGDLEDTFVKYFFVGKGVRRKFVG